MEDFFSTLYYYTNGLYSAELDSYLYETIPGYLHLGLLCVVVSIVVSALYYYLLAPVRRQMLWWFVYAGVNAIINMLIALYYSVTPLINNEISLELEWSGLDCFGLCIANVIWSVVFYLIAAFIIKWKSVAKYVPFKKF